MSGGNVMSGGRHGMSGSGRSLPTRIGSMKLTPVSVFHYYRLAYRSVIFLVLLFLYLYARLRQKDEFSITGLIEGPLKPLLLAVWALFVVEMILRFFPSRLESPGCQKQFAHNYVKTGLTRIEIEDNNAAVLTALVWIFFNGIFGALYMTGIFDDGIMILLSSFYSVCDMICILFFCPFQSWLLRNKCCSTCRIYNWDYAMMFTPLFFVRKSWSWSLLAISFILLVRWELTVYRYPERFSENTNGYLHCDHCTEKLCAHKKQLKTLWKKIAEFTDLPIEAVWELAV